jgi:hypothetical protein
LGWRPHLTLTKIPILPRHTVTSTSPVLAGESAQASVPSATHLALYLGSGWATACLNADGELNLQRQPPFPRYADHTETEKTICTGERFPVARPMVAQV